MDAEQATQVAALIDYDSRGDALPTELPADGAGQACHLAVGGGRALLLGPEPVPAAVGLVHRAEVIEVDALAPLQFAHHGGGKPRHAVVAVVAQVDGAAAPGVGGEAVAGEVDGGGVEESQEVGHAAPAGQLQEAALPRLPRPVVGALRREEAFGARGGLNLGRIALFGTARAQVEPPHREADALRTARGVVVGGEEPVGYLLLLGLGPQAHKLHAPGVGGPEVADGLLGTCGVYLPDHGRLGRGHERGTQQREGGEEPPQR